MPRVLRINDENKFDELVDKIGVHVLVPVNDGDGNLILPVEVLQNPVFSSMWSLISQSTTEIEYIPFPTDEAELATKLQQLEQANKLIKINFQTEEVEHKGKKIKLKKSDNVVAVAASGGVVSRAVSSVKAFFLNLFN